MNRLLENTELLCSIDGVSGDEQSVAREIIRQIDGHCEWSVDNLGNLIAFKKGRQTPKKKIMLAAHMDEVGFIITYLEESGLLRFATVGGIDPRVILGKRVRIGERRILGVVGVKPVHLLTAKQKDEVVETKDMYLDIGASTAEEAGALVQPGDTAVFDSEFLRLGGDLVKCRALDDRAGCAIMIELIRSELEYDCSFAFTVQEEVGTLGVKTAAYAVDPDIAVIIETTAAGDIAGSEGQKKVSQVGKGPVISYMDRGAIYDRELYRIAFETAKANGIPAQTKTMIAGGNDARSAQVAGDGVRVMALSLPSRYLHSASNVLSVTDLENTLRLAEKVIGAVGGL